MRKTMHQPVRRRIGPVLAVACLTFAGLAATSGATADAVATTNGQIVYPYTCTTMFAGGASYTGDPLQVGITDVLNTPGVHRYGGGPIPTQVHVAVELGPAAVSALLGTGTTDWTSTEARIGWDGTTSPATSFTWHVPPIALFSDRVPISFTTASFALPGPGDVRPGPISWNFQANTGVQPGFESGHVQCTPIAAVQIYSTFLPASGPSCAHVSTRWTCRFSYTGETQLWQVPRDVTHVTLDVRGASGGGVDPTGFLNDVDKVWPGGRGGESIATVAVTPGEYLSLLVGGTNGFNGGGRAELSAGGGASDVRRAPSGLSQRLVVAGGGGGGGLDVGCSPNSCPDNSGGAGGGTTGVGAGGGPGTQTSGGAAQPGGDPGVPTTPGSFGGGGSGGAGGGGGYYGGGGGAFFQGFNAVGGGGGGSGFVPPGPGNTTVVGTNSGDGSISISYTSSTTPYTSRYTADEARWLLTDIAALRSRDLASTQHDAALSMILVEAIIWATHATPPNLGSAPGTGPISVTSTYSAAENAALVGASSFFRTDPPTLQRAGVAFLAFLIGTAGH